MRSLTSLKPKDLPYVHQAYPKWKYHPTLESVIVQSAGEELRLGPGWVDSPADFALNPNVARSSDRYRELPCILSKSAPQSFQEVVSETDDIVSMYQVL